MNSIFPKFELDRIIISKVMKVLKFTIFTKSCLAYSASQNVSREELYVNNDNNFAKELYFGSITLSAIYAMTRPGRIAIRELR